jgi:arylsulfatase A-like enzyme
MEAHGPYRPRAPYGGRFRAEIGPDSAYPPLAAFADFGAFDYFELERFRNVEDLLAAYDEAIATADAEVGALLAFLRAAGVYDDALIIVTSDHGESFCDHDTWLGHGLFLYEEEIRVPLVVKLPGNRRAGERVRQMARLVDVAPTILSVAEVALPAAFDGRPLTDPPPRDGVVAIGVSTNTGSTYVRTDEWMYVSPWTASLEEVAALHFLPRGAAATIGPIDTSEQLWKIDEDPRQRSNRIAAPGWESERTRLRSMAGEMIELESVTRAHASEPPADALRPEQVEALRALGYLRELPPVGH